MFTVWNWQCKETIPVFMQMLPASLYKKTLKQNALCRQLMKACCTVLQTLPGNESWEGRDGKEMRGEQE